MCTQPRLCTKMPIATMPVKKIGRETPPRAPIIAARSQTEPRLSAETTPVLTPAMSQRTHAPAASAAVTGSASLSVFHTGSSVTKE